MPSPKFTYSPPEDVPSSVLREDGVESGFIGTLQGVKYEYRADITNRAALERNFREKFEFLTGSGKTLTSIKASALLKDNSDIVKCLFVMDRKGLDRQTREEFKLFLEGCVEEKINIAALVRRLHFDNRQKFRLN